jgi:hypothetical protein
MARLLLKRKHRLNRRHSERSNSGEHLQGQMHASDRFDTPNPEGHCATMRVVDPSPVRLPWQQRSVDALPAAAMAAAAASC